jgi:oligopeptide/dipeptide ABC transporter ATP-binding protein
MDSNTVLAVHDLTVEYHTVGMRPMTAVDHVSFALGRGETLALIGESGSGKSTLGYALIRLLPPNARVVDGAVWVAGVGDAAAMPDRRYEAVRGKVLGMVFQGAQNMFNPIMPIGRQFADIFTAHGLAVEQGMSEAERLLRAVRLDPARVLKAYPHELSGGMRQRAAIVSAVMLHPTILILDEPTTALDVVSQAQVLAILRRIREEYGLSMLFITHDFAVAANIGDRIAVMYAGELVEVAPTHQIYRAPRHPYTRALIRAVPSLEDADRALTAIPGQPPDMRSVPPGCRFAPRCPYAAEVCRVERPRMVVDDADGSSAVACWKWAELEAEAVLHG